MSRSVTLWVILYLGICMGMVTATAREPKSENVELFGRRWSPIPWWRLPWRVYYPNYTPSPSVAYVIPPTVQMAPPSPPPPHAAPSPPPPPHIVPPLSPPPHMAPPSPSPPHAATSLPPQQPPLPLIDKVAPILLPPPLAFYSPVVNKPPSTQDDEPSDCSMVLINVDGCVSDLITSFFKDQVSLSVDCCRVISRISVDCFDAGFTHFRVPVLLTKVREYCRYHPTPPLLLSPPPPSVADVVLPPPPPQYMAPPLPPHVAPSLPPQPPSCSPPVDNMAPINPPTSPSPPPSPLHTAAPPLMPPHVAPSLPPQPPSSSPSSPPVHDNIAPIVSPPPPTFHPPVVNPPSSAFRGDEKNDCSTVLINVDGCVSDLITSFFKDQVSLSANCCRVVSRISDDCFDRAFTRVRVPVFLIKVRDYCSHQR